MQPPLALLHDAGTLRDQREGHLVTSDARAVTRVTRDAHESL